MGKFTLKRVTFSSKSQKDWDEEDEDYIKDIRRRYREERKNSKIVSPIEGALAGSLIAGARSRSGRAALLGAGLGAGAGILYHDKFVKPHTKELEEEEIAGYMHIKDKEGRRRKIDRDEANKARRDAGMFAGRGSTRGGIYGGW